jgi:hypothetical protein
MLPAICRSDRSDNGWGSNNGFTKKGRFLGVAAASVVCAQQEDAVQDKCADQHCAAQELIALYKKNKGIMYDSNFCKHVAEHLLALSDDDNGAALVCDIIRLEAQCKAQRNALGRQDTLEAEGVIASIVQKINDNIIDFATKKHCDEIVKDLYELG